MLSMLLAMLLAQAAFQRACPIHESPVTDESPSLCVSGVEFRFRDEAARQSFAKEPAAAMARVIGSRGLNGASYFVKRGAACGVSFFDPVARKSMILSRDGHIREADIRAVEQWQVVDGIAYPLGQRSSRQFRQNLKAYLAEPKKYSLWCPVMRKEMPTIEKAVGYLDRDGVRYFLCCESCMGSAGRSSGPGWDEALAKSKDWGKLKTD